jgi:peptide/nickel transport system substrate-binding protein
VFSGESLTRRRVAGAVVLGITAALAVALAFTGTGAHASAAKAVAKKGVLTVGLSGSSFQTMDRNALGVTNSQGIYDALFEPLVAVDAFPGQAGKLHPALATKWQRVNSRTWDFQIRKGVKFHNGQTLEAADAAFSLNLVLNNPQNWLNSRIGDIVQVRVLNKYKLRIVTKAPNVLTLGDISQISIYPRKYYSSAGAAAFGRKPVGTGPFKFQSWPGAVDVHLTRYDRYWGKKPSYKEVVFKPIDDPATRLAALLAGEIDIAYNLNIDDSTVLRSRGLRAVAAPVGQGTGINLLYLGGQPANNPLKDKRVRQALNYAIDKQAIVKNILLGSTRVLRGQVVGPDSFGFNPKLQPYPYNPTKAKQLLTEAGYPNGFAIDFQSASANYAKAAEVSQNVVAQLAKVGVRVRLQMLEWNVYLDKLIHATSAPMFYVGWNYYPVMDANFAIVNFLSKSPFKIFSNPKLDSLYEQETNTFNRAKRQKLLRQFMAVMRDQAPMIFLFQSPELYGVGKRVVGFRPSADDHPHIASVSLRG